MGHTWGRITRQIISIQLLFVCVTWREPLSRSCGNDLHTRKNAPASGLKACEPECHQCQRIAAPRSYEFPAVYEFSAVYQPEPILLEDENDKFRSVRMSELGRECEEGGGVVNLESAPPTHSEQAAVRQQPHRVALGVRLATPEPADACGSVQGAQVGDGAEGRDLRGVEWRVGGRILAVREHARYELGRQLRQTLGTRRGGHLPPLNQN